MLNFFTRAAIKKQSWPYKKELLALMFLGLAVFITCALLSYNPTDQTWFYYDTIATPTTNWCGFIGSIGAAVLFYLLGGASFLLVLTFLFLFYFFATRKTVAQEWDRILAYSFLPFIGATLLALHGIDLKTSFVSGGYIGANSIIFLQRWFESVGSIVFLYTLLCAALIVIFRFSFLSLFAFLARQCSLHNIWRRILRPAYRMIAFVCKKIKKSIYAVYAWIARKLFCDADHDQENISFEGGMLDQSQMPDIFDEIMWKALTSKKTNPQEAKLKEEKELAAVDKESQISPKIPKVDIESPAYILPDLELFVGVDDEQNDHALMQELEKRAIVLQEKLERFDVFGKVTAIKRGPVVTLFEYQPHIDTKISKIIALEDDLALALQATSIRIIAPIPGKSVVGFEVANKHRRGVLFSQLIKSETYKNSSAMLPMILGVDTIGNPIVIDLAKMPHLLVAGSTGSGKSVGLNAMLVSMLCRITPDDLRLIIIDPKRLEFAPYSDIAHLLFPIVTDPKQAPSVLRWVVKQMEERYITMAQAGSRNIADYRQWALKNDKPNLPYIVVVIDELADLMMCAGKEVEDAIIRIAQMARAAGIHLIVATQRPSVDVITGLIKVNFPSRISFRVTSKVDSRTILDCSGADKLLGRGDMLFLDANDSLLKRVHGAYVLDKEINQVIAHIRSQRVTDYLDLKKVCVDQAAALDSEQDIIFDQICNFLSEIDEVSISLLQRRFRIGYNRSARIIDMLEAQGKIAPSYGGKTRKVVR